MWLVRQRAVQRIGGGHRADQDQHDEAHALLAVVRAMGEGDARAGEDEQAANPPGRRRLALRLLVKLGLAHDELHQQQQQRRGREADDGRQQQRVADLRRLAPVDARGAVAAAHQRIGDADADDRADQRMRGRGRQAEPPGAEVPDDRGDEQGEDHREAGARADLQDQFHRQQRHDAEGDRAGRKQHAEEVEEARPDDGDIGRQRMGVDDRRDGVGGVVEAVDEFEAERDQQRDAEQDEGQIGHDRRAGLLQIAPDAPGREAQSRRR